MRWYLIAKVPEPYVLCESPDEAGLRQDAEMENVVRAFVGQKCRETVVVVPADVGLQDPDYREAILAWQREDDGVWEALQAQNAAEDAVLDELARLVEEGTAPESLLAPSSSEMAEAVGAQGGPDALDDVIAHRGPQTLGEGVDTFHDLAQDVAWAFTFRTFKLWEIAEDLDRKSVV